MPLRGWHGKLRQKVVWAKGKKVKARNYSDSFQETICLTWERYWFYEGSWRIVHLVCNWCQTWRQSLGAEKKGKEASPMPDYCCYAAEHWFGIRCVHVAFLDLATLAMVVPGLVLQAAEACLATTTKKPK